MNQPTSPISNTSKSFQSSTWIQQGLGFLGTVSLLGSGLGWTPAIASTETLVIPDSSTAVVKPDAFAPGPVKVPKSSPRVAPRQTVQPKPLLRRTAPLKPSEPKLAPKPSVSQTPETALPKVKLSAPKILDPATSKAAESPVMAQPQTVKLSPSVTIQGKNSYIDTNSYGNVPNQRVTPPEAVVLTERSTGCQTVVQNGQLSQGSCETVAKTQSTQPKPQTLAPRRVALANRQRTASKAVRSTPQVQPIRFKRRGVSPEQVVSLQPIAQQGLSLGLEPLPRYNRSASRYAPTGSSQSRTDLIFPLPVVANITSAFGWRIHPISRTRRMHNGTDFGAPLGTPVVATYEGEVSTADWLGGYGLTVILRHLEDTQESLYAHLSEVYVQPGEWVEQGTVIGRVGSTGHSTGPHLHFEWRHLTEQGWVAVDAGLHLEYALDNLMRTMQLARTPAKPEG